MRKLSLLLFSLASISLEAAHYQSSVSVTPMSHSNEFLVEMQIEKLDDGIPSPELLASPKIVCIRGEPAELKIGSEDKSDLLSIKVLVPENFPQTSVQASILMKENGTPVPCVDSQQYLKDLEEQGYCVIPRVLSDSETKVLYERVWHEFIEKAWPNCKMDDQSNWKEAFPIHNTMGIFSGPAGQIQAMWDLRQDLRIINVFAHIWNTDDLIVSMDGLSFMCPPEIRKGYIEPWPHVDQAILRRQDGVAHSNNPPTGFISESSLKTEPYTIQGQFLFEDSFEDDGGFYCIPKSHLKFTEFAPELERIISEMTGFRKRKARTEFLEGFFAESQDELGSSYVKKHVTAPRGSLILWDSRTVHWNQHASENRPYSDSPKVRMVGYLCYVPKSRSTNDGMALRRKAFEKSVSTGHNPVFPEHKYSKDHIFQEFIHYLEDASYIHPKIHLSPIGEALLGP